MRKFHKNVMQLWGKAVHNSCTACAQGRGLCSWIFTWLAAYVHKPGSFTGSYTWFLRLVIPAIPGFFTAVKGIVIPTIHTTYKENNKSKILKFTTFYTLPTEGL